MRNKYLLFGIFIGALIVGFYYFSNFFAKQTKFFGVTAFVYKTPTCSCCENYITYLKSNGFKVEKKIVNDEELTNLKKQIGLPENLWSCHTVLLNNYFVEGHIPIEVIGKLLTEKPEINGIALPEMPSDSPRISGFKIEKWKIHSIKNGQDQGIFMEI
jgi:hypothetical protein